MESSTAARPAANEVANRHLRIHEVNGDMRDLCCRTIGWSEWTAKPSRDEFTVDVK
jgi:hypothetical protein